MLCHAFAAALLSAASVAASQLPSLDYEHLPNTTLFPGPWEQYIKAPKDKGRISPARIYRIRGNVSTSTADDGDHELGSGLMLGAGGTLSLEFQENIAGRCAQYM